MANPQPGTQQPGAPSPKRDHSVLIAIIGAVGLAVAAVLGGLVGHATASPSPAPIPRSSSSADPGHPAAPKLDFVPESAGTVPWCNIFFIQASRPLPSGYMILIFDASADTKFNVTSYYSYDNYNNPVTPAPTQVDEWESGPVYVASPYKQDAKGNNIIRDGREVSNAGYTVVVFAVLVPNSVGQLLDNVAHANILLKRLPPGVIAEAQFDATRNGNVKQCSASTS